MNLDPATIDKILELGAPNISTHEGLEFSDKSLNVITPPASDFIVVSTLAGLVDLIKAQVNRITDATAVEYMLHIDSPTTVRFVPRAVDKFGRRWPIAKAEFPKTVTPFRFGAWHDPENFIIAVQSGFQRLFIDNQRGLIGDLDYVLKIASNISAEASTTNQDDGISQNVTMKQGIVLKGETTLKNRVTLAPFRTFTEIDQVISEFVFRTKTDGDRILLALFEADGGRWQINAAAAISDWLTPKVGAIPIVK